MSESPLWTDYGRLLRLSLAPSALADVLVGVIVGAGGHWVGGPAPWLLMASSLCIYHGAMALNDWADREVDARVRPDRPLPSGRVSSSSCLGLALLLMLSGVILAWIASTPAGIWMGAVACLAVLYDLWGRGSVIGPLLLACCRGGNLLAGLALAGWSQGATAPPFWTLYPALLYAAYVFLVSRLGLLEDLAPGTQLGQRPRALLRSLAGCMLASLPLALLLPGASSILQGKIYGAGALLVLAGAAVRLWRSGDRAAWSSADVLGAMGLALRSTLALNLGLLLHLSAPGRFAVLWAALALLASIPISFRLRRLFPPS